jgi:hypothetical protein
MHRTILFAIIILCYFGHLGMCSAQSLNVKGYHIINQKKSIESETALTLNKIIDEYQYYLKAIASKGVPNNVKSKYIQCVLGLTIGCGEIISDSCCRIHQAVTTQFFANNASNRSILLTTKRFLKYLSSCRQFVPEIISADIFVADVKNVFDLGNGKVCINLYSKCRFDSGCYEDVTFRKISVYFDKSKIDLLKSLGKDELILIGNTVVKNKK